MDPQVGSTNISGLDPSFHQPRRADGRGSTHHWAANRQGTSGAVTVDRFFWLSDAERRHATELGDKCAEAGEKNMGDDTRLCPPSYVCWIIIPMKTIDITHPQKKTYIDSLEL